MAVLRKTRNAFQLAQPGMYSGSIYTRAGARIDIVGQEKTGLLLVNDTNVNDVTRLEGCLSFYHAQSTRCRRHAGRML